MNNGLILILESLSCSVRLLGEKGSISINNGLSIDKLSSQLIISIISYETINYRARFNRFSTKQILKTFILRSQRRQIVLTSAANPILAFSPVRANAGSRNFAEQYLLDQSKKGPNRYNVNCSVESCFSEQESGYTMHKHG